MTWKRSNPDPTPEQLAAWADGELDCADAERVEAWLRVRPGAGSAAHAAASLVHLYRDHPPPEPSEQAWQAVLSGIDAGLHNPLPTAAGGKRKSPWRMRLLIGLAATAAVLGGVVLARTYWPERPVAPDAPEVVKAPTPPPIPDEPDEPDEPFPVAAAGEVNIISIDVEDADRVVMVGQPLLGTFELAAPEDIEIVQMEPWPEDGRMPRLHRGPEVPMIVVAAADPTEP